MKKALPYVWGFMVMVILTVLVTPLKGFLGPVNIAMVYLLPVILSAAYWGTGPALMAAVVGVITFDYFFVPPRLSFTVADLRYLVSFAIFVLVGYINGRLSKRVKKEVSHSRQREARVAALYALSRDIAAVSDLDAVLESVTRNVAETVSGHVVLLLPDGSGKLALRSSSQMNTHYMFTQVEMDAADWAFQHGREAGHGTEKAGDVKGMYLPLRTEQGVQGVLGVTFDSPKKTLHSDQIKLLEAFAGLTALAVNRINLAEQAREALTLIESERLRTALFNSLSHDLRTPLSSIIGAVTGLLEEDSVYSPAARHDLLQTIKQGAVRMHRFVNNLLDMARLESGMLKLKKEWCDIQDIIGVAVNQLGESLRSRPLKTCIEPELPMVNMDFVLIQQVLINLLDNALKYSPAESEIAIRVDKVDRQLQISVADRGTKIPEDDLSRIFDKFYRITSPLQVSGTGLGLAICRGIIEAHGGAIWAENNNDEGATIFFTLPVSEKTPVIEGDNDGFQSSSHTGY